MHKKGKLQTFLLSFEIIALQRAELKYVHNIKTELMTEGHKLSLYTKHCIQSKQPHIQMW